MICFFEFGPNDAYVCLDCRWLVSKTDCLDVVPASLGL